MSLRASPRGKTLWKEVSQETDPVRIDHTALAGMEPVLLTDAHVFPFECEPGIFRCRAFCFTLLRRETVTKRFTLLLAALAGIYAPAYGQSAATADTGNVYTFSPIEIIRDTLSSPSSSTRTILFINRGTEAGSPDLSPLLADRSGLFIKDYGGASGLKTISQRGMSSEHTLVLINGVRLNAFEDGLVDLGTIPLDAASIVEIQNGGQSAEYGADAVAGTVNIQTNRPPAYRNAEASVSMGSFGRERMQASVDEVGAARSFLEAGIGRERASEDFPFTFHNGDLTRPVDRLGADFASSFGHLRGAFDAEGTFVSGYADVFSSDRGTPGAFTTVGLHPAARQADRDALAQVEASTPLSPTAGLQDFAQVNYAYEQYQDPGVETAGIPLNDYYKNLDTRLGSNLRVALDSQTGITTGLEMVRTGGEGNSLVDAVHREQMGAFASAHIGLLRDSGEVREFTVFPAFRADAFSTASPFYSPQLGVGAALRAFDAGPVKNIAPVLRASIGRNYRMPTFNELFYTGGGGIGNPDLKPERSVSSDAGVDAGFDWFGHHVIHVTYFDINMDDRIVWVPTAGINVTPVNLQSTRSSGWEAGYTWSSGEAFTLDANYTLNSSRKISADFAGDPAAGKQLIYIPEEMGNVGVVSTLPSIAGALQSVSIDGSVHFTGFRFYEEDNSEFLPSYAIADLGFGATGAWGGAVSHLNFEIENFFNKDYQVIVSYPMPGRWYRLTFGVQY